VLNRNVWSSYSDLLLFKVFSTQEGIIADCRLQIQPEEIKEFVIRAKKLYCFSLLWNAAQFFPVGIYMVSTSSGRSLGKEKKQYLSVDHFNRINSSLTSG